MQRVTSAETSLDGFKIADGADGESGFDDIDAQNFELAGDLDFFSERQRCASGDCSPSRNVVSKIRTVSMIDSKQKCKKQKNPTIR